MKQPSNHPSANSNTKSLTEVQSQLLKMTTVVSQIQTVLHNIYHSESLSKTISSEIFKSFLASLNLTISTLLKFPHQQSNQQTPRSKKPEGFSKISQCMDEQDEQRSADPIEIHSQILPNELFQSKLSHLNQDMTDIKKKNFELKQQNEYLTDKLCEAEKYIRKIQEINDGLLREGFRGRSSSMSDLMGKQREREKEKEKERDKVVSELMEEIETLKEQLRESEDFINRSNEEFIKQIHRKSEKVWRLQKEIDGMKSRMSEDQSGKSEQEFMINKLKEENFRLEVLNRNLKVTSTPIKSEKSSKVFEKLLKDRVLTAASLDIQEAFRKKL